MLIQKIETAKKNGGVQQASKKERGLGERNFCPRLSVLHSRTTGGGWEFALADFCQPRKAGLAVKSLRQDFL